MLEPPTSWAYAAKPTPTYDYDLKKAGKLLDGAGWTKGAGGIRTKDGQELHFTVVVGNDKNWDADIQAMQESRRQIGVVADLRVEETAQVSAAVAIGRDFDMLLTEFGFTAVDPDPTNSITSASAASGGLNGSTTETPRWTASAGRRWRRPIRRTGSECIGPCRTWSPKTLPGCPW